MARTSTIILPPCLQPGILEAGCDEAGRGCLAGPVVAAAVILPDDYARAGVVDSKKLSASRREELRDLILAEAVACGVGICSPEEIDSLNILRASIEAMHRAVTALSVRPGALIVDGNRFTPYPGIPHTTVVKGDARFASIAAASIIAKTTRDRIMDGLAAEFPQYGWAANKGYPTAEHRAAIAAHGATVHHRRSFRLV